MPQRTITFDDEQWQLVPRQATHQMLMDLKDRAGDIAKVVHKEKRVELSCDFGLVYRLLLASAPVHVRED